MGKRHGQRQKNLAIYGIAVLTCALCAAPAGIALAETNAAFNAHYEHRAQVETELLARVQALTPAERAHGAALAQSVTALNARILPMYTGDQALSAVGARPLPPARVAQEVLPALRVAAASVAVEIRAFTRAASGNPALRGRVVGLIASARRAEQVIVQEISTASTAVRRPAFRKSATAQSVVLQGTIARLQTTAISLMNAWLLLADTAWVGSQPVTAQDLAYTKGTIAVPSKGQGPIADTVGVQPRVTDASGQVLPDTGTYRLRGPARFHGVFVDRLIGTVTVRPGATPGQYTVTYTQGHAMEQVILQVVP